MAIQPPNKTLKADLNTGALPNTAPNQPNTTKAKVTAATTSSNHGWPNTCPYPYTIPPCYASWWAIAPSWNAINVLTPFPYPSKTTRSHSLFTYYQLAVLTLFWAWSGLNNWARWLLITPPCLWSSTIWAYRPSFAQMSRLGRYLHHLNIFDAWSTLDPRRPCSTSPFIPFLASPLPLKHHTPSQKSNTYLPNMTLSSSTRLPYHHLAKSSTISHFNQTPTSWMSDRTTTPTLKRSK